MELLSTMDSYSRTLVSTLHPLLSSSSTIIQSQRLLFLRRVLISLSQLVGLFIAPQVAEVLHLIYRHLDNNYI